VANVNQVYKYTIASRTWQALLADASPPNIVCAICTSPVDSYIYIAAVATIPTVFAYNIIPCSSPRRVRSSWVKVPPVELGGSRRNGQVPVQPRGWRGLSSPGKNRRAEMKMNNVQ
jgi:hypothetical protein